MNMENQLQKMGEQHENSPILKNEIEIYHNASMLVVSDKETEKLLAAFDENLIEIRPDGLIYLPQTFWRQRLNTTFGIGQWAIIPKATTKDPDKNKLYYEGVLLVRGSYVATAVGEAEYHESNKGQSWASVYESSKSDCITRCCKDLGIASELWQPQFIRKWVAKYAIQVQVNEYNGTKLRWRRKDQPSLKGEIPPPQPPAMPLISQKQYDSLKQRVQSGELEAADKAFNAFSFTPEQHSELVNIYLSVKNQNP